VLEAGIVGEHAAWKGPTITPAQFGVDDSSGQPLLNLSIPPGLEGVQRAERGGAGLPESIVARVWVQSESAEARESCVELVSYGAAP
jgi:hypothetical protein